ncbi:hypothetical protein QPK87_30140 [Kamptonema cortianum]|nr:hypothetical protein [Kamptonema cortianum]
MLRTNNADFRVGSGNGASGSAFGQVWISNASSVIVGNQDNNWQGWRIGYYGGSGAGQKATGLVTFADVGSMNIRLGEFQVGYRDAYGELLFQNVTNLNIRSQSFWVGERENGSTDGGHGYFYVDGGSSLTNFRVDGEMNIGRAGNSTGRVIIDGVLGDYFVGQSMRVGNLAGGTGSFIATNANNNGSFYVGHSFFCGGLGWGE